MTTKPDLPPRVRCKAITKVGKQCNRPRFSPYDKHCCSHIAKEYRASLRLLIVFSLLFAVLPLASAIPIIVTSQLNHTVNIRQGDTKAVTATFQVNNTQNRSVDAIVFFITRDPTIVTVDEVAEDARNQRIDPGVHNISSGLFGLKLGTVYVDYGIITDVREPFITDRHPYGMLALGTKTVNMTVYTEDANAQCRYADQPRRFQNMVNKFTDSKTNHTVLLTGLENNKSYEYYVRCWIPINSTQINQSSFLVNVTCPRVGWCGDGTPAVWTELALNYTNVNQRDYVINFSVGNVYPPPPVIEPPRPIVIKIKPINVTPYIPPKTVNLTNLTANNVTIPQKPQLNISNTTISISVTNNSNGISNISVPIQNVILNDSSEPVNATIIAKQEMAKTQEYVAAGLFFACLLALLMVDVIAYVVAKNS